MRKGPYRTVQGCNPSCVAERAANLHAVPKASRAPPQIPVDKPLARRLARHQPACKSQLSVSPCFDQVARPGELFAPTFGDCLPLSVGATHATPALHTRSQAHRLQRCPFKLLLFAESAFVQPGCPGHIRVDDCPFAGPTAVVKHPEADVVGLGKGGRGWPCLGRTGQHSSCLTFNTNPNLLKDKTHRSHDIQIGSEVQEIPGELAFVFFVLAPLAPTPATIQDLHPQTGTKLVPCFMSCLKGDLTRCCSCTRERGANMRPSGFQGLPKGKGGANTRP